MLSSRFSITTWVRAESSVPIRGSQDPLPQLHDRCRQFGDLGLLTDDHLLTRALVCFHHEQAEGIDQFADRQRLGGEALRVGCENGAETGNSGCFSDRMKVAVSVGEKPCRARELDTSARTSRSGAKDVLRCS